MADQSETSGGENLLRLRRSQKPEWFLRMVHGLELSLGRMGGREFYRWSSLSPGRFRIRHEEIRVRDLPEGLRGFRIAQLSDLHAGAFVGEGDLRPIVERVNEFGVDVIALTGDYVSHRVEDIAKLVDDLSRLEARRGIYAVLGNHDYRGRRESDIVDALSSFGTRFLRNEGVRIDTGEGVLHLSGIEDISEGHEINPQAARAELQAGDVEVFLCHNPAGARHLAQEGCAVVLSGHTHGGQIDVPGVPNPPPRHPGDRLEFGSTTSIVNRGLGAVGIPLRWRSPAEVVVVTLQLDE